MDTIIEAFLGAIQPPWNVVLGVLALIFVAAPRAINLRRELLDTRAGRRCLQIERDQLETLKLRYEIEALRERHSLPEIHLDSDEHSEVELAPSAASDHRVGWRCRFKGWLLAHRRLGRPIAALTQFYLLFLAWIFAIAIVAVPFALTNQTLESQEEPALPVVPEILIAVGSYTLFLWLSCRYYKRVKMWRHEVASMHNIAL